MKAYKFYFYGNNDNENDQELTEIFLTHVIRNFNLRWSFKKTIPQMKMREIKNGLYDEFNHCLYLKKYKRLFEIYDIDLLY